MHKEDIKARLRKKFGSAHQFEREYGLPKDSLSDHLRGRSSRRVADAVAAALEKEVFDLWPDRYRRPARISDRSDNSPARRAPQRQIAGAR